MPVSFVGEKPKTELRACYSSADMIILPSVRAASGDQDGLPVVLLESLASGLPTIASDLPGIDTVVSHRKTGLLVTPATKRRSPAPSMSLQPIRNCAAPFPKRARTALPTAPSLPSESVMRRCSKRSRVCDENRNCWGQRLHRKCPHRSRTEGGPQRRTLHARKPDLGR
ncbi:glycosyltransferase [Flaviflexus ciconiae]|uniref:Glycosyltransferase n=1 Tax=Flaviflexus ciconiae TaxID=2496867 RepID=A0A3Q9G5S4_9ACTO|nr:glycosyltransferase [Flaviflexus ciconiae]